MKTKNDPLIAPRSGFPAFMVFISMAAVAVTICFVVLNRLLDVF